MWLRPHFPRRRARSRIELSVVVVVYNIPREAPRTLLSLSPGYQRDIDPNDYEVIVVDNGSNPPFDPQCMERLAGNFRLVRIDPASPSPAAAVNRGITLAAGDVIGVMVDGARIATPGLLHFARHGARLFEQAIVATLGWYLGHDLQALSMLSGYDAEREDRLLDSIQWPQDGYRLFEIATMDESSIDGWFLSLSESSALFMRRKSWEALGGFDERFDMPGGGLVNLDTFARALALPDARPVILLAEATFHQVHGGVATNAPPEPFRQQLGQWLAQYLAIRGCAWEAPPTQHPPTYLGPLPRAARARLVRAAIDPVMPSSLQPLGPSFDLWSWPDPPAPPPADPVVAALVELMRSEFRAGRYDAVAVIARLARARAPEEHEPLRLLALLGAYFSSRDWDSPPPRSARFHLAVGHAYFLTGDHASAGAEFRSAIRVDPDLVEAQRALSRLAVPGTGASQ